MVPNEHERLRREWMELAPQWIREARAGGDVARQGLLDEYTLAACGDVQGLRILDSGCGEGRFSAFWYSGVPSTCWVWITARP